jgi:poly(A) polymerase
MGNDYPLIVPRPEHIISRSNISKYAIKVLYRLKSEGYSAYLVGGGVRDLLLNKLPKDFDVATDAQPEDVKRVFRNCRLIGRRFRLAHVCFGREVIEVATFRAGATAEQHEVSHSGRILHDNVYGTIEEDAQRRDFTANALYYNINDFSVVAFSEGYQHVMDRKLCIIGDDPEVRFREDPVRMLRAIRFAAKLSFDIEERCVEPIKQLGHLLMDVPPARLFDEVLKLFLHGHAESTFDLLREYNLLAALFPQIAQYIENDESGNVMRFIRQGMQNTDARVNAGKPVTPAFLFAVFLWPSVNELACATESEFGNMAESIHAACDKVVKNQQGHTSIPRRIIHPMREIWTMQPRFLHRKGKRPLRLLSHPKFRAGYDFYLLRAETGEADEMIGEWWTKFQEMSEDEKKSFTKTDRPVKKKKSNKKSA